MHINIYSVYSVHLFVFFFFLVFLIVHEIMFMVEVGVCVCQSYRA